MRYYEYGTVFGWTYFISAGLTLIVLIGKSIQSYKATDKKQPVALKIFAAFAVWLFLSLGALIPVAGYSMGDAEEFNPYVEFSTAEASVIGVLLAYVSIGFGLAYWIARQRKA